MMVLPDRCHVIPLLFWGLMRRLLRACLRAFRLVFNNGSRQDTRCPNGLWSTLRGESSGKRCGCLGAPVFGRNRNRARNRIGYQETLTAYSIMKLKKRD